MIFQYFFSFFLLNYHYPDCLFDCLSLLRTYNSRKGWCLKTNLNVINSFVSISRLRFPLISRPQRWDCLSMFWLLKSSFCFAWSSSWGSTPCLLPNHFLFTLIFLLPLVSNCLFRYWECFPLFKLISFSKSWKILISCWFDCFLCCVGVDRWESSLFLCRWFSWAAFSFWIWPRRCWYWWVARRTLKFCRSNAPLRD